MIKHGTASIQLYFGLVLLAVVGAFIAYAVSKILFRTPATPELARILDSPLSFVVVFQLLAFGVYCALPAHRRTKKFGDAVQAAIALAEAEEIIGRLEKAYSSKDAAKASTLLRRGEPHFSHLDRYRRAAARLRGFPSRDST